VVKVPLGALFRDGDRWAVLVIEDAHARRRHVVVGHTGAEEAEVERGLLPGDRVILYPGDEVADGARVASRSLPAE
jgi:HlyD family secretion protein